METEREKTSVAVKERIFAFYRGNTDITGISQKLIALRFVTAFLERAADAKVYEGKHIVMVRMPDVRGDAAWMKENIIREGDIVGTADRPAAISARADAMVRRYEEINNGIRYAGTDTLKYWLEHFYMQYDEWGPEDV